MRCCGPGDRRKPYVDLAIAAALTLAGVVSYRLASGPVALQQSSAPHFVMLADALLHRHLWIDPAVASHMGDVTRGGDHYYVAFPPLPAVLMLPLVAAIGPGLPDPLFTITLGALNIGLAYLVARRLAAPGFAGEGTGVGRLYAAAVAVLLGWGTVHFYSALRGRVWETAHIVSVTFLLLYVWECAGRGRPLIAGAALAAAFLSRAPIILAMPLWLVLEYSQVTDLGRRVVDTCTRVYALVATAIRGSLPLLLAVVVAAAAIRFTLAPTSPFDQALLVDARLLWAWPCLVVFQLARVGPGVLARDSQEKSPKSYEGCHRVAGWRAGSWRRLALFGVPLALAVALLMAQNAIRFGSPFDMGYVQMDVQSMLLSRLKQYGLFHPYFLPQNAAVLLTTTPTLAGAGDRVVLPWLALLTEPRALARALATPATQRGYVFPIEFSAWGNAIWSVSPALVFALRPGAAHLARLWTAAWLSILPIALLHLLYYNTGWTQFGYRFSLDYTPFLLVLVLIGLRPPLGAWRRAVWWLLLAGSVVLNLIGARWVMGLAPY